MALLDPGAAEFWVLVAFIIFFAIVFYMKVPALLAGALDKRADAIRKELDEARLLREEAQALLADYQKKRREAEDEAKDIVQQARRDAESLAATTEKQLEETVARREKLAEEKIARAEAQALSEVRGSAIDAAMKAAEKILADKVTGAKSDELIGQSLADIKAKLN
ncbi:MAG: F0F1 ATP synthase subunit B [Hyphomicrobiaceae bacterium]|nr:F0F1 ATP synthase subunit B [Hyphomicrobiaceae bacterium]MCC0010862.1 F0F1 ATP synthase subunit B [Hyphomicrobiaceae bacterium]